MTVGGGHRDAALDLVRVLGVVAIVAGHVWPDTWVRAATFPWHVPVFFVLTGYLWHRRPWRAEAASRVRTLLRPYAFWLVVLTAVVLPLRRVVDGFTASPGDLVWGGIRLIEPYNAYWFVTCLFCCCLLYAAADRAGPAWRAVAVAAAGVSTVVGTGWLALWPLSAGLALPCLVFVEGGRQLHRLDGWLGRRSAVLSALAVVAGAAALVAAGVMPVLDLKIGDVGVPVVGVVVAVGLSGALVVLARAVVRRLGAVAAAALTAAASSLVPVVLVHGLVREVPATGAATAVQFAVGLLVPLALALALRRTRLAGWALGR